MSKAPTRGRLVLQFAQAQGWTDRTKTQERL